MSRLPAAIARLVQEAAETGGQTVQLGSVQSNDLTVELFESGIVLHGDEVELGQGMRAYHRDTGIARGDTVVLVRKATGGEIHWVIIDVLADTNPVAATPPSATITELARPFLGDDWDRPAWMEGAGSGLFMLEDGEWTSLYGWVTKYNPGVDHVTPVASGTPGLFLAPDTVVTLPERVRDNVGVQNRCIAYPLGSGAGIPGNIPLVGWSGIKGDTDEPALVFAPELTAAAGTLVIPDEWIGVEVSVNFRWHKNSWEPGVGPALD